MEKTDWIDRLHDAMKIASKEVCSARKEKRKVDPNIAEGYYLESDETTWSLIPLANLQEARSDLILYHILEEMNNLTE